MRLHEDREAFLYAVGLAAERSRIRGSFLEKDYWVTMALKRLSQSEYREAVVFKGGTSLTKCYGICERFSEDVDLAIDNPHALKAGAKKTLLKRVEATVAADLWQRPDDSGKSGSKRTTTHDFPQIVGQTGGGPTSEYLKLEITAYSQVYPSTLMPVESYLGKTLRENGQLDVVEEFGLSPFEIRVLGLERTFTEKVMALIKRSYSPDPIQSLQEKVRHIYDLQQILAKRSEMVSFLQSDDFFDFLGQVAADDAINRTSDPIWLCNPFGGCCLFNQIEETWRKIEPAYQGPFKGLLFGELPPAEDILASLTMIGTRLAAYDQLLASETMKPGASARACEASLSMLSGEPGHRSSGEYPNRHGDEGPDDLDDDYDEEGDHDAPDLDHQVDEGPEQTP